MKKVLFSLLFISILLLHLKAEAQSTRGNSKPKYDTIIKLHVARPVKKPAAKQTPPQQLILPVPEYVNQPYYYDKDGNQLIRLENATAQMITKKKILGLKGARQSLTMEAPSSKIRFTAKKDIVYFIKTSGDVIDLTSYIKLYKFAPSGEKREVTINTKEGLLNATEDAKGKLVPFSVKMTLKDIYSIQMPEQLEAGEYGFVWVKNMELKEFAVFAFGIDWKNSN